MVRFSRRPLLLLCTLTALAGCEPPVVTGPTGVMSDYVTGVSARGDSVIGTLRAGPLPSGGTGAVASVTGISGAVNGGAAQVTLTGTQSFQRVLVGVQGVDAYYDLMLPSGSSLEDLIVGVAPGVQDGSLKLQYVIEGPRGLGPVTAQTMRVVRVGTGDVQVSVSWTGASDLDLHVFDPAGEEIYYNHRSSKSGGLLDLDSNAACTIDGRNAENVVWPAQGAPHGTYRVVLDYYDDCGAPQTDWVVTVQVAGAEVHTYTGTFTGQGISTPLLEVVDFTR